MQDLTVHALLVLSCAGLVLSHAAQNKPHIVVIVADDLGFNDVPWHNPAVLAPTLQSLAEEGIILEQHYALPKCAPSRAALLTGVYPYKLGRQHESLSPMIPTGLSTKYRLLPEYLRGAGYSTHAVGKWHLGYCHRDYTPTRRGFDSFFGFYTHGEDYYTRISSDHSDLFSGYDLRSGEDVSYKDVGKYSANLFSDEAVQLIEAHEPEKPLFLYLAYQSIHKPVQVPEQYARMYQPEGELTLTSLRLGMLSALDEGVMNITLALQKRKLFDDTVLLFLSDNGGYIKDSNWPLRGKKNSVYEGGTRTVSFFHYPRIKSELRGRVSENLIHIVDWFPTILTLAGASLNATGTDGIDQSLHLTAGWPGPRNELIYNINDELRVTAAVRVGRWKLIWGYPEGLTSDYTKKETKHKYIQTFHKATKAGLVYLYDLRTDPYETTNVAEQNIQITRQLKDRVWRILKSGELEPPDFPEAEPLSLPSLYGGVVTSGWCQPK